MECWGRLVLGLMALGSGERSRAHSGATLNGQDGRARLYGAFFGGSVRSSSVLFFECMKIWVVEAIKAMLASQFKHRSCFRDHDDIP